MTIGARIRRYRNESGMTQRELADEVGLTESAIRNYERDIRMPSYQQIERIAEALDVSADSIREIGVSGARGVLEVLFRYEKELGLMPVVTEDGVAVARDPAKEGSQKAAQALKAHEGPARHRRDRRGRLRDLEGSFHGLGQGI